MIASREYVKDLISKVLKGGIHKDGRYLYNGTTKIGLTTDFTLYVSSTGDDTTGDGSQTKPFRQISKAISMIPRDMCGFNVTINVSGGNYNAFTASCLRNGIIIINFTGSPTITGATLFEYCDTVHLYGDVNFTYNTHRTSVWVAAVTFSDVKDAAYWSGTMTCTGIRNSSGNTTNSRGITCRNNTKFTGNYESGFLKVVNCEQGLCVEQNSSVYFHTITNSGCESSICYQGGGILRCHTYSGKASVANGGEIHVS